MRQGCADVNQIQLHGCLGELPALSHTNHGVEFFRFPLQVSRLSGALDQVNIMASRAVLEACGPLEPGQEASVVGELRTFNNRSGVGSRLVVSVLARELRAQEGQDENHLELSGTLCKPPSLRTTPLGRTICDMILAVNRKYGRADYLPCIAWGSLARRCGAMSVGDQLCLSGRLQSRIYTKAAENGPEERTAFEVSIMSMEERGGFPAPARPADPGRDAALI